jgi:hypothetical protein
MNMFDRLATPPPELIWGLVSRGLGLVFLVSFASLLVQILPIAGRHGLLPIHDALRAVERDFPTRKRWLYFPSLLWLNASDNTLRALGWFGIVAASSIIVGGPHTPWAFAVCYAIYLSLDRAMTLIYPWDAVLFESGFWGMFLPATQLLPSVSAVAAPLPAVAWVYRLLVFRVMFGFGKHKFVGTTAQDAGFLRGFLANQPLPTYLGWASQKLPLGFLKLVLFGMFLVEIPLQFAVFFPGPWSAFAATISIALMLAIWLTGNFGYFNLVMIVAALSWFDTDTAQRFSLRGLFAPGAPLLVHALFVLHTWLALMALPFNSFCTHTWTLWSLWTRIRPPFWTWLVVSVRALSPLRLAHAYGVFPPQSPAPARMTPVGEVSWDGAHWYTLSNRFSPTQATSPPRFCAPHHERFDQAVVYEGIGLNEMSVFRNAVGRWDPYGHGGVPAPLMLLHRVLAGSAPGERFYDRSLERQQGRPRFARVRTHMLEPSSLAELRSSGKWWTSTLVGPHFPPMTLEDGFWDAPLPPPELWHFDDVIWLRRSRLGALMQRSAAGEDPHGLVRDGAVELELEDLKLFWDVWLPGVGTRHRTDWVGLRSTVEGMRKEYGRSRLYRFERIANRYAIFLLARLEPLFMDGGIKALFGRAKATLDVKTIYHLRLLTHHIVAQGRQLYDAVMAEPTLALEQAERMTMFTGNTFHALFRYEALVYQSQKVRLLLALTKQIGRREPSEKQRQSRRGFEELAERSFGAIDLVEFLKTQFTSVEDVLDIPECWPRFKLTREAEVVRVGGPRDQQVVEEAERALEPPVES